MRKMTEIDELKKIKKVYGEKFMQMCRRNFNTILEKEGLLYQILLATFSENCKTLYEDIMKAEIENQFKNYIYSKINVESRDKKIITDKTPFEIMSEAGYDLYECKVESEIQEFRKYYRQGEELCTFNGGRLNKCVVFFAVKKNVEEIKRENFDKPQREDEYGTSVISIQFDKIGVCTVSIKNRYNHTVNNPDATFGNDLERIAPGLTNSFAKLLKMKHELELDIRNIEKLEIPNYVVANDGKYYRYNMEISGVYYCPDNIIIENGIPKKLEHTESQILIDYFILNLKDKTIKLYDETIEDCFPYTFGELKKSKIIIEKNKEKGTRLIRIQKEEQEYITIEIDKNNQIIGYKNLEVEYIGNSFLEYNRNIIRLELPELQEVENDFLYFNEVLSELELPKLQKIGNFFLYRNEVLTELKLPKLQQIGNYFLIYNEILIRLELPELQRTGDYFLWNNEILSKLVLPKLQQTGDNFLCINRELTELRLPKLQRVGRYFLNATERLSRLELPELYQIGENCLIYNENLLYVNIPKLPNVENRILKEIEAKSQSKKLSMKRVIEYSVNQKITEEQVEQAEKNNECETNLDGEKSIY